jgi:hypothetical protein
LWLYRKSFAEKVLRLCRCRLKNSFMTPKKESPTPYATGCRFCGRTDVELRRGLCDAHYQRFIRKRKELAKQSSEKARSFEAKCVEEGWIESKSKGGKPVELDAFEMIVREVEAEFQRDIDAALARDNAAQAKEDLKKRATKKPGSRKAN